MSGRDEFFRRHDVSRETIERLDIYEALIQKWNPVINLVSTSTLADVWKRHFSDSAQIVPYAQDAGNWVDLGSGAGFPGLVTAIVAAEAHPDTKVALVESDARKAVFLQTVIRETGVAAKVHTARAEVLAPQAANVVSARALAPLVVLLGHAQRHLGPKGRAILLKGVGAQAEIDAALAVWRFRVHKTRSETDPAGVILEIGEIERA